MFQTHISYLPSTTDVTKVFPEWIVQHCEQTSNVLDVGAGQGRTGLAANIQPKVARLVGVDPDASIIENPYLIERYQVSLEEFAKRQNFNSQFDCLYMRFVMEHITQPHAFLSACHSLLRPDGMLFGVTPNLWHYFGMATKVSASLGIEDWLLERLIGKQAKESYHYPTAYRLNSIKAISHTLAQAGFREVTFQCFDQTQRFESYFPNLLHWFPGIYTALVYALKQPKMMGLIMFRAIA